MYGKYLRLAQETRWDQNFYKLLKQDPKKLSMNLILEVYEQFDDSVDLEADNVSEKSKRDFLENFTDDQRAASERMFGYAILKINNPDFTIRYGTYDLNLYKPPINMRKRLQKDMH